MTVTEISTPPSTISPCSDSADGLRSPRQGRQLPPPMEAFSKYLFSLGEDNPEENTTQSGESRRQPVVLVVEDESFQAVFLQRMLRRLGYEAPEHAVTGPEAIEKAVRTSPDLILMDVRLRGSMDGITAADLIQRNRGVPVIYMTAYADQATVRRAHHTNCYGFLEKPVDDNVLRNAIESALNRRKAELDGTEPDPGH